MKQHMKTRRTRNEKTILDTSNHQRTQNNRKPNVDRLRHICSRNTYSNKTNLLVSAHKHKQRLVLKQRLKTVHERINRQRTASEGAQMVSKKTVDLIRKWHADRIPISYICKQTGLTEQHVKAIIKQPKTAEEWNRTIFSNHH